MSDKNNSICPLCGAKMVIRYKKSDGHPFWGCSKYFSKDRCKGIRAVEVKKVEDKQ